MDLRPCGDDGVADDAQLYRPRRDTQPPGPRGNGERSDVRDRADVRVATRADTEELVRHGETGDVRLPARCSRERTRANTQKPSALCFLSIIKYIYFYKPGCINLIAL